MKKIASFIVGKKYLLLMIMFILTIASFFAMFKVRINGDMTKYLPNSSPMKVGLDIMTEEFPDAGINATFKVMFDDLTPEQIVEMQENLKAIPGVDTVTYSKNSSDYNKDNHTLFVLQSHHKYGTSEEKAIEKALKNNYRQYEMVWSNDNTGMIDIPVWIFIAAVAVLMLILFATSNSWIEPPLFLFVIGSAILLNMGTNVFLSSVSDITYSISAILQLVISMDYSIILSNRYRQEKLNNPDKIEAMKSALYHAFASVASSAMTTVIGLLMLCFMRFKIGRDIGIVLAKGVFMSMICVLLMLPGILLFCDKAIEKTNKKSLHIPMNGLAKFSYKARFVILPIFLVLVGGSFFLQNKTNISYIFSSADKIKEIFPPNNTMVFLYENKDEEAVRNLTDIISEDENVRSINGYYATISKTYSAENLAAYMSSMSEDSALSAGLVNMLYYIYYGGQEINSVKVSDLMNFISDTVLKDPMISGYMDPAVLENSSMISKFSSRKNLEKPMTIKEMSALFNISESDIKDLLVLYYSGKEDFDAGKMSLNKFANFIINDLSKDPELSSMFDETTTSQIKSLAKLTDTENVTKAIDYKNAAKILEQNEEMGKMLYVCYFALSEKNVISNMKFHEFVNVLLTKILPNPDFSAYIDNDMKNEIKRLEIFSNKTEVQTKRNPEQMAAVLGIEEKEAKQIFNLKGDKTMTVEEVINYMLSTQVIAKRLGDENRAQLQTLQKIINVTVSEKSLSAEETSELLGMDAIFAKILYTYNSISDDEKWNTSLHTLINYIVDNGSKVESLIGKENLVQMATAKEIINSAAERTEYTPEKLSAFSGMEKSQARQLYVLNQARHGDTSKWHISIKAFLDFIVDTVMQNDEYSSRIDDSYKKMLVPAKTIVAAVVSDESYTVKQISQLLAGFSDQIDENTMKLLYLYYAGAKNSDSSWKMSVEQLMTYLINDVLNDSRFNAFFDDTTKEILISSKAQIEDGKAMLKTGNYSRLIINTSFSDESPETFKFISDINDFCGKNFTGKHYMIGNSAMAYEMQQTFRMELLFITLLTIAAIFLIVALTFKSLSVPLILVLLVQCGVNITITVTGFLYGGIIYLALLIVECILMGATIDYGILFSNYYCEYRKTLSVQEAIAKSYDGAQHTIFTSGLILIFVTAIVGNFFGDPTVSAIIRTISLGALSAVLLIVFVLPGILAACDKLITFRNKNK